MDYKDVEINKFLINPSTNFYYLIIRKDESTFDYFRCESSIISLAKNRPAYGWDDTQNWFNMFYYSEPKKGSEYIETLFKYGVKTI